MDINDKLRDVIDWILIGIRFLVSAVIFCFGIVIPLLFFMVKIISALTTPLPRSVEGFVGVILFTAGLLYISYLSHYSKFDISNWIHTGHFKTDISDEKNHEMRIRWMKNHKPRTKPRKFRIYLTDINNLIFLAPTYPEKFGNPDPMAEPLNYRALVSITHKFRGNLPIAGDEIKFEWVTTSNNDISNLHVRAVEVFPDRETKTAVWEELDTNGETGAVCAENIKTGKRFKISHSVKIAKNCQEGISLCFWNEVNESEGESVLAYKF